MKLASGLRLRRRGALKRAKQYRRMARHLEVRRQDFAPGSSPYMATTANIVLQLNLANNAEAEAKALARQIDAL